MNAVIVIFAVIISAISLSVAWSYARKHFPKLLATLGDLSAVDNQVMFTMVMITGAMLGLFPGVFFITASQTWLDWLVVPISAVFSPLILLMLITYFRIGFLLFTGLSAFYRWCTKLAGTAAGAQSQSH